jgi:hypothetical protein
MGSKPRVAPAGTMQLSEKWVPRLLSQPETGMGYQSVTVRLRDGRAFDDVVVVGGLVMRVPGFESVPFSEADISDIVVTHGSGNRR